MNLATIREQIRPICVDMDIEMLGVFGSVARGDDDAASDIDLLVRFKKPVGLLDLIEIEERFAKALGRTVDLGTEASLHPLIKANVAEELKVLYEG